MNPSTLLPVVYQKAAETAAAFVRGKIASRRPTVGIVLGSGLGKFAESLDDAVRIPYAAIKDFPVSAVEGHAGVLHCGYVGDTCAVVMQGRVHFYEGWSMLEVVLPIRTMIRLGIKTLVVTNAAGGINRAYRSGTLVAMSDHLNLMGANPLTGPNVADFGPRFPDMTDAYDPKLIAHAQACADKLGIPLPCGVYAALAGPSYETPAEIRMLATLGADTVGMSTVPEVIVARHMGVRCLGISCVTNLAAGISRTKLSHEEVKETADRVSGQFIQFLTEVVSTLPPAA